MGSVSTTSDQACISAEPLNSLTRAVETQIDHDEISSFLCEVQTRDVDQVGPEEAEGDGLQHRDAEGTQRGGLSLGRCQQLQTQLGDGGRGRHAEIKYLTPGTRQVD